jgi:multidrug efflux pump subunit AcrB
MEDALGTISHVENVYTISSENFAMTQLEFEDDTDMDSAMVKVSSALDQVRATLPDGCGTPSILELSMDMVATMYIGVEKDGADVYQLSDYVNNELVPYLEREEGVASITEIGLVEKTVQVELNRSKINEVNDRILEKTNSALEDARRKLVDAQKKVDDGQDELEKQESGFGDLLAEGIFGGIKPGVEELTKNIGEQVDQLTKTMNDVRYVVEVHGAEARATVEDAAYDFAEARGEAQAKVESAMATAYEAQEAYNELVTQLQNAAAASSDLQSEAFANAVNAYSASESALADAQTAYNEARMAYEFADESMKPELEEALYYAELALDDAAADREAAYADLVAAQSALSDAHATVPQLQEMLAQALTTMMNANTDLQNAQIELTNAIMNEQGALTQARSAFDMEALAAETGDVINGLNETRAMLNGSSLSALMSAVSKLSTLVPQARSLLTDVAYVVSNSPMSSSVSAAQTDVGDVSDLMDKVPELLDTLQQVYAGLTQGQLDAAVGFSTATVQLSSAQAQLKAAREQYESARKTALENANADALLKASTLSQLVYAQNFTMPAGYIDDKNDESWMLRVGDEYDNSEEIADALLVDIDEIGPIHLTDVADITVIDNSMDAYARLNGQPAVMLSVFKNSSTGTNELSRNINEAIDEYHEKNPDVHIIKLMDQGDYITLIVEDVLSSMIIGAILAVIILALFLRDVRPTLLVGISIPLSVLFAIVLMYFSDLSLNIMTLSGLSLGIGMLVDNSIVVIENIFRLRGRQVAAPRAAVQGTKQVSGAIIASTMTTICVFFPMVFTSGTVRKLLVPMALSISYCLIASLAVAMTVVPAASSTIFRNVLPKQSRVMNAVQEMYEKALRFCLRFKLPTIGLAVILLILSIIRLVTMGVVIIPDMAADEIQVSIRTPEEDTREMSYRHVDEVMDIIMKIDNVDEVGILSASSALSMVTSAVNSDAYGAYTCYVQPKEGTSPRDVKKIVDRINKATENIEAEVSASSGAMSDMSTLMASGLSINIYGKELDTLNEISEDVMEYVESVDGFYDVSNGSEEAAKTLHLVIDKDKAMSYGLTVAQIFGEIAQRLTTSVTSTTISNGGETLEVVIIDETNLLTKENILDMEFEESSLAGAQTGAMGGASSQSGAMMGGSSSGNMSAIASFGDDSDDEEEEEEEEKNTKHRLGEFATLEETYAQGTIRRENLTRYITVSASTEEGRNTELLTRELRTKLASYKPPEGYRVEIAGESTQINDMLRQMSELMAVALLFIYLVMVAQFQSLLSPFIVMFTIPLAFTGGMIGLIITRQQLSMLSLMGFLILMGTIVNNGIVFVDYTNQLRMGGMERRDALVATGKTRMRPILMTALTTILAMSKMIIGDGLGSQMGRGMATVIAAGLIYATFMTLFVVPVMYDIFFRRQPLSVDTGDDLDEVPDDAAEFIEEMKRRRELEDELDGVMPDFFKNRKTGRSGLFRR